MELRYYRYIYPSFLGQNGLDFYWKTHFSVWIFISFRFVVIDIHKIINHPNYYIIHIENQSIYFSLLYQGLKSPWLTALEKPRNKAFLWCPKKILRTGWCKLTPILKGLGLLLSERIKTWLGKLPHNCCIYWNKIVCFTVFKLFDS